MAYREYGMWEVLDVLRRIHRGERQRHVARVTGRTPKTVRRYLAKATELGWVPGEHEPDERLAAEVLAKSRPGPRDAVAETEEALTPLREEIRQWLKPQDGYRRGLRLSKIHTLLKRRKVDVSYSALYRFACKHLEFGRQASTVRVADVSAGEVAEVDFGRLGLVYDPASGRRRLLHALVVTLVFSRHQYVHVTRSQKLEDLIDGLEEAWESFGGVPARVILDNLKAAVVKADRYEPVFQRVFNDYATHRGFVIDAAVARHPTGKPHVERQVQYVRENFFRGEQWLGREHVQREAIRWCIEVAGKRIHGTTRKQPLEQFEAIEKAALKPLAAERFDTPQWAELKVHPDHHVRLGQALYSVPYQHNKRPTKGRQVTVRADRRLVRIYLGGELLKTHPRRSPGGRSTDYCDYPPEKTAYAMRDANYLIQKAKSRGESVERFTERLLSGQFPWAKLRQAQALLRMADKYGTKRVDAACRRALSFDLVNVKRVERIVIDGLEAKPSNSNARQVAPKVVQLPLKFLRSGQSLIHQPNKEETVHGSPSIA